MNRRPQLEGQRIDIIPSINASPLFPISFFWASHLMNYLTADSFCAAYPEYTFAQRAVLSPVQLIDHRYPSPEIVRVIRKYEDRGYQFRVRPYAWNDCIGNALCARNAACPRLRRFFGDRFCLTGNLSRDYGDDGFGRSLPSETTVCWWRGGDVCGGECARSDVFPERDFAAAEVIDVYPLAPGL